MPRPLPCLILLGSCLWAGTAPAGDEPFRIGRWIQPVARQSVLAEAGYYVWCGSVVEDAGKYHMFYSRWPVSPWAFADGWLFASEICHAVADRPEGPFTPTGVVLGKRQDDAAMAHWDSQTQHNPHIRKFGGKLYLYYMASVDPGAAVWPSITQRNRIQRNQRIGVIAADSIADLLAGNFVRPDAPILAPVYSTSASTDRTTNPTDYAANRIVNNESVIERPDGKFQLIYKSNWPQSPSYGHGFALADTPAGPFTLAPGPIFSDRGREDENHWYDSSRSKYYLICKNFSTGSTELLESGDSVSWTTSGTQFGRFIPWADGDVEFVEALERPQLLRDTNGVPVMLYMAARRALPGGAKETFNVSLPLAPPAANAFPFTDPAAIRDSGLLVQAANFGAAAPVTLKGITFAPAGTNTASLVTNFGFSQSGGASGASLATGLMDSTFEGAPEFEGFLDTMVWQTATPQAGAALSFQLSGLTSGRRYRLQLFFGESRSGSPTRHGPQSLVIDGNPQPVFDYGPGAKLVDGDARGLLVEAHFTAKASTAPVKLLQHDTGGGLQISAFALHDVSPPEGASIERDPEGTASVGWTVVPGFTYHVEVSSDLFAWDAAPGGTFEPAGEAPVRLSYQDQPSPPEQRFYRLVQEDPQGT